MASICEHYLSPQWLLATCYPFLDRLADRFNRNTHTLTGFGSLPSSYIIHPYLGLSNTAQHSAKGWKHTHTYTHTNMHIPTHYTHTRSQGFSMCRLKVEVNNRAVIHNQDNLINLLKSVTQKKRHLLHALPNTYYPRHTHTHTHEK